MATQSGMGVLCVSRVVLLALLVLQCVCGNLWAAGPRAEVVGEGKVDFGRYPARERKEASYRVRNAGDELLKILKVRSTCGACAEISCQPKELKPGDTATVKAVILGNSIFGKYRKFIYLQTSDPAEKTVRLTIAGHAVPLVEVQPKRKVHAGRLPVGRPWSHTFRLTCTKEGVRLGKPSVEGSYPVEATLKSTAGKTEQYELRLALIPQAANGDLKCVIRVPVTGPDAATGEHVELTVTAAVGGTLVVFPAAVSLPDKADEPVRRTFALKLVGGEGLAFDAQHIQWGRIDGVTIDFEQKKGQSIPATATFSPGFLSGDAPPRTITFRLPGASPATLTCATQPGTPH